MVKICLDAGHYGDYNRSPAVPEYYESHMNWKLHLLLKKELEAYGIQVTTTRSDPDTDLSLEKRGRAGKGCGLVLSLHSNAASSKVHEDIDYVVGYVMLDGSSDELGQALVETVAATMDTRQKPYIKTREGKNGEYYGVLRGAAAVGVPGIILEHSFHTNTRSTRWLMEEENLQKLAQAEAKVIAAHFGLPAQRPGEGVGDGGDAAPPKATLYRVQTGAFSKLENAQKQVEALHKAGFEAIIKIDDKH